MAENSDKRRENVASLGCGTLILIAIIVMIFSGNDTTELTNEIASLQRKVETLRVEQAETQRLVETLVLRSGGDAPLPAGDDAAP
tara:strand:- start:86 stop:340 length:255 start_codon:yes stop_codon:yes gene_type:complete